MGSELNFFTLIVIDIRLNSTDSTLVIDVCLMVGKQLSV